ncbi:Ankyrin repeat-containing protein ITN1 [Vitis vinifera]|uniref:Ankyrin repeat-containing protein ITN1 n=1 Tax=Vitis vinifera TaxID=29760 RepID=A0A438GKY4_VITVI|nr:Ankyrin repeat-containing protein ITN1 [Vitis vinifera]
MAQPVLLMVAEPRPHTWMLISTRLHHKATSQGCSSYNTRLQQLQPGDLGRQRTPKSNTILHIASQFGRLDCVEWIVQLTSFSSLLKINLKGDTPLHLAAREGHLTVVQALIQAAKSLPSLHEAVRYHHPEVVKFFIEEDPQFTYGPNISGGTPLYMEVEGGHGDLVQIITGINTSTSPAYSGILGRTALHAAVIRNDQEITTKLLEWKPSLTNEVDENGWSPLQCAAHFGYTTIVKQLLHKSPDKSVACLGIKRGKKTALLIAAKRGHKDIVICGYLTLQIVASSKSKEVGIGPLSWVPGETHLIVAALVATVTFEAGFTFPGGYNENDGKAILAKKAAFKAFVVTDTLAMVFSGVSLTMFGMGSMVVAFMTGMYAVLPHFSGFRSLFESSAAAFSSSSIIYLNNFKKAEGLEA